MADEACEATLGNQYSGKCWPKLASPCGGGGDRVGGAPGGGAAGGSGIGGHGKGQPSVVRGEDGVFATGSGGGAGGAHPAVASGGGGHGSGGIVIIAYPS